jgi:hypothetical protein
MLQRNYLLFVALIVLTAIMRVLPHPPNFTPVVAMGLFGAAHFRRIWAIVVPFLGLFLSDLYLNNVVYSQYYEGFVWVTSWWVYAAFAATMLVGYIFLKEKINPTRVIGSSLTASVVFFLVSNLSAFFESQMYPRTWEGLVTCYAAGLPFLLRSGLGDLLFAGLMFGSYAWLTRRQVATA